MLEGVLATVLNRLVGEYVQNLEQGQLNIAVWKGDVVLRNLRLKREALDKFNLPIDVVEGYLGELTLTIPWSDLANSPVRVNVKDLFVLAGPKAESEYDPILEQERLQRQKMDKLEIFDSIMANRDVTGAIPSSQQQSFLASLVTKILDNLQVNIENIHVRYEDKTSNPQHPFSVGITLSALSIKSTNDKYEEAFISGDVQVIHKKLALESLALYFNTDATMLGGTFDSMEGFLSAFKSLIATIGQLPKHQYILRPVSGSGRLAVNKHQAPDAKANLGHFDFEEFALVLDDQQYSNVMMLLASFTAYGVSQKYRHLRPEASTPMTDPKAWFKFAGNAVLSDIRERRRLWTWQFFKERKEDRESYVKIWKKNRTGIPLSVEESQALEDLQRKLSFDDLRLYRTYAIMQLRKEGRDAVRSQPEAPAPSSSYSWLSSWWGGSTAEESGPRINTSATESPLPMSEDEIRSAIYDVIDFDPAESVPDLVFPLDHIDFVINVGLKSGSISLQRKVGADSTSSLVSLVFDDLGGEYIKRPKSFTFKSEIGNMTLRDDSTPGSLYPLLLSAKQSKDMKTLDRHSESFFKLRYDQNPLEKGHGDHYVDIRILPVEYVHNPEAIGAVAKFFSRPDDDDEAIEMIKSVAEDTLKDLRAQTQAGLEQILLQRKTTVLRIDAEAPVIVVPDSVTRADAPIVILDMGRLTVDSEPVDADLKEMVRDHGEASLPESEYQRLKESMYDRYVCKLTAVQVVTGRDFAVCVDQLVAINPDPAYHVFDRINLELAVEACLLPREPDLTKLKLGLGVEKLHLNFSDRKYKRIMRAIQLLIGADELAGGRETGANLHLPKETVARERHMRSRSLSEMVLPRMTSVGASLEDLLPDATVEGGEEGFFDAPEVPFALPLGAYDVERVTGRDEPGHVAVDFSLAVDSMSATVRRTDRAALNTRSVDEPGTILAELSVTNFGVRVLVRPLDLGVKVHVGNVQIIDRMQSYGPAFDVLLQSKTDAENLGQGKEGKHFVAVTYRGFQREHPEYAGVDHEVAVDFASVTLMLTPDSLLEIQDFVLATFGSDSGAQLPTSAPSPLLESKSAGSAEARSNGVVDVRISMDSIVLAVNRRGAMIASGSVAKGALNIRLNEASMVVNGRLGSFVIEDHMRRREAFANFVSFAGDQVAEFTYVTYDPRSVDYPGYDSFIELTTESVRIVYLEYLLSALLDWLGDLNRARVAMEIARLSAANSAAFIQETSGRMRFLVKIKTPIIILPRPAETSNDMLEAHLGEITCSNRYLVGSGNAVSTGRRFETINEITLDVQKMRLWSSIYLDSGKTFEQRLAMIRDLSWKMTLRLNEGVQDAVIPAMAVDADLGDASARMTEKQYALLLEVLDNILSPSDHTDPTANEHAPPPELDLPDNNEQSLASSDRGNDPSIFIALDVSVSISTLGLEIFVADSMDTGESALETTGLAEFLINGITINASISNQGDLMLETVMNSFSVKDTRVNNASIFREVVPSNRYGKNQLVIQYTRDRKGATDVALAIDGLLSILSVRYVFDLWAFFMMPKYFDRTAYAPETVASAPPESKSAEDKVDDASAAQPPLSYRINLVDAEIIILGDPTAKDTEAIVLAANQIFLSQDATLVLAFKQAGLFLINMDRRQENRFRIVSSFDMALRQQISSREHRLTIDVSPNRALEIRVSYRDFALFTKLSRLVADISGGNEPSPSPGLPSAGPRSIAFSPPDSSQNADATSKHETLELNLGGLEAVLIDDVSDPMIQMINIRMSPVVLQLRDWSSTFGLSLPLGIAVNYFNVKNSHWEPLVEPWNCLITMSRSSPSAATDVKFVSSTKLDLNITQVFLETLTSTLQSIGTVSDRNLQHRRTLHAPFLIRNRTGYDMVIWAENAGDSTDGTGTVLKELPNNTDTRYKFVDWRKMREAQAATANLLSVQLNTPTTPWETLKSLAVNSEGTTSYILRPKINNVAYRLAVDVKLRDNIKYVTLRSTFVIRNDCMVGIEVALFASGARTSRGTYRIAPGTEFALPILYVHDSSFQIRPEEQFGYHFSNEIVNWTSLKRAGPNPRLTCKPMDRRAALFRFSLFSKFYTDPTDNYPELLLTIAPPIELENLLPFDIKYTLFVRPIMEEFREMLPKGQVSKIHTVEPTDPLALGVEITATGHKNTDVAILNKAEINYRDETIRMRDRNGRALLLRLKYAESKHRGTKISIYCPFVMVDRSTLGLQVKPKGGSRDFSAGSNPNSNVFLFSFPEFDEASSRAVVRVGDSDWSRTMGFDPVGSVYTLDIVSSERGTGYQLGVSVKEGDGKYYLSKVVTFSPRFILKNNMDVDILCRQHKTSETLVLQAGQRRPILQFQQLPQKEGERLLCLKLAGSIHQWSAPVRLEDIGTTYIKMHRQDTEIEDLIRMETILQDATVHVIFSRQDGPWPFEIENKSAVEITLYQHSINNSYTIPQNKTLPYAWDSPSLTDKVLMVKVGNTIRELNIAKIGPTEPFKYRLASGRVGTLAVDIKSKGPTTLILVSDYDAETNVFKATAAKTVANRLSASGAVEEARASTPGGERPEEEFEVMSVNNPALLKFSAELSFIGLSIINSDMQEVLYTSFQGARVIYVDRALDSSYDITVGWMQVDNCLPDSVEPIVLYPTQISKEFDEAQPPLLTVLVMHLKDRSYGIDYYKGVKVSLQEVSVELDEDLLRTVLDVFKFTSPKSSLDGTFIDDVDMPEPQESMGEKVFFELLMLAPIKINLSFTRTERGEGDETRRGRSVLSLALDVLTTTVGNVHDAALQLNMLEITNASLNFNELIVKIEQRYRMELMNQIHRIIGSADFLGNPVGLFNTVSSGVVDMFYEPLQGFSFERPEDFGTGFVKGAKSFARKTVYGFSDTFSKVTGSFGKGLAVVTMDDDFVARRSAFRLRRNRPKNAIGGVRSGLAYLGSSVASGVAGVFTKPLQGAQSDNALGFVTGIGKGVIGLFAKPVVGVIDVSNQLFEGIKSTATDVSEIDRVRLPRFVGRDKVLRPYNAAQARGLFRLRTSGADFVTDSYIADLELEDGRIAVLSDRHLIVGRNDTSPAEWSIGVSEIVTVRLQRCDIIVSHKSRGGFQTTKVLQGLRAKASCAPDFFSKLEHLVSRYQLAQRRE